MSKESSARQYWAKRRLFKSERPFAKETLEEIGEVADVTKRLSDGKLVTTPEMTAELTTLICTGRKARVRRLKSVPFPEDEKTDESDS